MNPATGGMTEGFGRHFNIFLYSAAESADRRVFDGPGDLIHRFKITRRGDREAGFNNIHAKILEFESKLQFFLGIQLTARHLFSVAEGGIKDENFSFSHK